MAIVVLIFVLVLNVVVVVVVVVAVVSNPETENFHFPVQDAFFYAGREPCSRACCRCRCSWSCCGYYIISIRVYDIDGLSTINHFSLSRLGLRLRPLHGNLSNWNCLFHCLLFRQEKQTGNLSQNNLARYVGIPPFLSFLMERR